jgi:hypothetical protein
MKLKQITIMKYVALIIPLMMASVVFATSRVPKPPEPKMITWEKAVASLKVKGQLRH